MKKQKDTIVLVHGLGRTSWSMYPLASYFVSLGYPTVRLGYHSRRGVVAEHATHLRSLIEEKRLDSRQIIFVAIELQSGFWFR